MVIQKLLDCIVAAASEGKLEWKGTVTDCTARLETITQVGFTPDWFELRLLSGPEDSLSIQSNLSNEAVCIYRKTLYDNLNSLSAYDGLVGLAQAAVKLKNDKATEEMLRRLVGRLTQ